jgi:ammonia channel protein AmtB
MVNDPLFYIVIAAILIVFLILMSGLIAFMGGGEFNRKYANKIMQARIVAQFIAVLLILLYVYLKRGFI